MPLYEYRCDSCAKVFEELVSSSREASIACPSCGSASVRRQLSVFAAHGAHAEPACASTCAQGGCDPSAGPPSGGCCGGACHH